MLFWFYQKHLIIKYHLPGLIKKHFVTFCNLLTHNGDDKTNLNLMKIISVWITWKKSELFTIQELKCPGFFFAQNPITDTYFAIGKSQKLSNFIRACVKLKKIVFKKFVFSKSLFNSKQS